MKIIKITFVVLGVLAFSTSYGQDQDREKLEKQKKQFDKIDKDSNEAISLEEMTIFYEGKKNKSGDIINADKMFKNKDNNADGKLTFEEFIAKPEKKKKK
ncbi:EF-hand domain-containing protein [Mariniflexile sp. AS56]|uniref:EF-hand domain-containing protein n=1 Tax=Mariniflexile sp. AS56 TaxID=3063957 RepID=UPI0026F062B3|nr:EF-hand domain-containing protein [Mariniflexile sp. AS56]MDO7173159.1 hypothetical protein [Mariniflexile sp. AS56]